MIFDSDAVKPGFPIVPIEGETKNPAKERDFFVCDRYLHSLLEVSSEDPRIRDEFSSSTYFAHNRICGILSRHSCKGHIVCRCCATI
jgi:hypothetical protein